MQTRARRTALAMTAIAIGLVGPAIIAELLLRMLPVGSGAYTTRVDASHPILHFEPNRDYAASVGPRLEYATRGRINNAGWVSQQSYDSTATTPLLALIGDSYVEAFIVPYEQSVQGRLARAAGPGRRVYAFGMSGWPLSQYLAVAQHVRVSYRPVALAVTIISNDFDESLLRYKSARGLHYLAEVAPDSLKLTRVDYTPRWHYWFVRHSALARYALGHLHVLTHLRNLFSRDRRPAAANDFVGNAPRVVEPERIAWSKRAVDHFLAELPRKSGLMPGQIVFIIDGMRPQLYDPSELARAGTSYYGQMREYFMGRARSQGFEVVDIQPVFASHYAAHRTRFERPHDGHWNALGHSLVASAMTRSSVFRQFTNGALEAR